MPSVDRELPTVLVAPVARPIRAGRAGLGSHQPPAGAGPGASARVGARRLGISEAYAAIALLSFLVARFVPVLSVHYPCPFLMFTGQPCATCGMTHAFVYLAHGHVLQALRWNPLGALLAASAWAFTLADLVRLAAGRRFPAFSEPLVRRVALIAAALLLANWAYLLIHGLGE